MKILKKLKKRIILGVLLAAVLTGGVAYAVFSDKAEVMGTSVSVASADLKLLDDINGGIGSENLVDSKPGPVFEYIGNDWVEYYPVRIFNNGNGELSLSSFADYETANDPDDLRNYVVVEPILWDDVNSDGVVEESELGFSYGGRSVVKWKTQGFSLGTIQSGEVKSFALRFDTDPLPDSKQGASMVFNFDFTSTEIQ